MKLIILNLLILFMGFNLIAQTSWTVDNRPGTTAQFTSVQTAIDAANPGDTIYVSPSLTGYTNININKTIHLRGLGHNPELVNGLNATIGTITFSTFDGNPSHPSNSSIAGLKFTNLYNTAPSNGNFNILIQNNYITFMDLGNVNGFTIQGNIFNTASGGTSVIIGGTGENLISHNIFNISSNGITTSVAVISGASSLSTVNNNVFIFNGTTSSPPIFSNSTNPVANNNIFVINNSVSNTIRNPNSTVNFQNCLTFSYGGQTISALPGTNNLNNTNPQFESIGAPENPLFAYTKSYKLKAGSAAIDAGTDGDDLGVYSQGFLFQMRGYPFDIPYPTSINITNVLAQIGNTLNVVLKANANPEY